MIDKKIFGIFGWSCFILGFVIIIFNAIISLFSLLFNWPWLSIIGLVIIIIGMKFIRISKEGKTKKISKSKK